MTPPSSPLVSIVLPTLNGSRFIASSIASCLAQTYPHFELIVVDGGSRDGTLDVVRSFDDPRIRVVHQGDNQDKLPGALNIGFDASQGEYLTWTQDDDLYAPEALAVMVSHLQAHPEVGLVYTGYWRMDAAGRITGESEQHPPDALWYTNAVGHCFLYRRDLAAQADGYRQIVRECLEAEGVEILFHQIAIKPGKPLAFGAVHRTDGSAARRLFFGSYQLEVEAEGARHSRTVNLVRPSFYDGGAEDLVVRVDL